jgi:hypothetical protein
VDAQLRIDITQNMDVVGQDFQFENIHSQIVGDLANDFLQANVYAIDKHFPTILWTEDNVVLAREEDVFVASELVHANIILHEPI